MTFEATYSVKYQVWKSCCWSTMTRLTEKLPQHNDWIYVRMWCECGNACTYYRDIGEFERETGVTTQLVAPAMCCRIDGIGDDL